MRQKGLVLLFAFFLAAECGTAWAQLNSNPWLNANDEEDVAKVYAKRQRRQRGNALQNYQAEESVTIDRTHAYIQDTETEPKNTSLLEKVTSSFSGQSAEEKPLIANTQENRQKLAAQKKAAAAVAQNEAKDEGSLFSLPDFGGQADKLTQSVRQPLAKAKGMFNQFKRTTAGSLRAIGKQFK